MKRIIIIVCIVGIHFLIYGSQVDTTVAKRVGEVFWKSKAGMPVQKNALNLNLVYQSISETKDLSRNVYFHVFNVDSAGFIIVSGSDNTIPVLAYSDEGVFDPNNIPPNMSTVLNNYTQTIRYAMENDISISKNIEKQWQELVNDNVKKQKDFASTIYPLLGNIKWDQGKYYNDLCPEDNSASYPLDYKCPTGCVATAMAQVIKYWEYPVQGTGYKCYQADYGYSDSDYGIYGELCADFTNTTYNYDLMPDELDYSSSSAQVNAVAELMYHCGVAVNMQYGPQGSGAYTVLRDNDFNYTDGAGNYYTDAAAGLRNYFGYSKAKGLFKSDYTDSEWIAILKGQLNKRQPVIYAGQSNDGGHAFVCDGYDENDYFHFNWGWGGSANCYCSVSELIPGGTGIGGGNGDYSQNQRIVIDICSEKEEKVLGWRYTTDYIGNSSGIFSSRAADLFPDTCMLIFKDNQPFAATDVHAYGAVFDPYSTSFDYGTSSLLRKSSSYRIDSLAITGIYSLKNNGYNSNSPDTLRIHLSYYEPYTGAGLNVDYKLGFFNEVRPYIQRTGAVSQKGDVIKPKALNTVTIDYILTLADTSAEIIGLPGSYNYKSHIIPLDYNNATVNGFEVPAGAVVNTMIKFIPGYHYAKNDTLFSYTTDYYSGNINTFSQKNNRFRFRYHYSSVQNDILDTNGYNCALAETKDIRYQLYNTWEDSCYMGPMVSVPEFAYHISYDITPVIARKEIDTTVCGTFAYNGMTYAQSGIYTHTFSLDDGDSIVILNLTVDPALGTISNIQGGTTISNVGTYTYSVSAVDNASVYQWTISNNRWNIIGSGNQITLNITEKGTGILSVKAIHDNGICETQEVSITINFCDELGTMGEIQGESYITSVGTYTYSVDAVENAVLYQWEVSNNTWTILGSSAGPSINLLIDKNATATLSVKAFDFCDKFVQKDFVIHCSGVDVVSYNDAKNIKIFPNPTKNVFTISSENLDLENSEIYLCDIAGRYLKKYTFNHAQTTIDLSTFAEGVYFISIIKDNKTLVVKKIIKN